MPRETITTEDDLRLRVGWQAQGTVQVGVDRDGDQPGEGGLWATLDRQGCNDAIRILRRARDAAFGRDE